MEEKPVDFTQKSASSSIKSESLLPEKQKSEEEKQISFSYSTIDDEPFDLGKKSTYSSAAFHSRCAEKQKYLEEKLISTNDSVPTCGQSRLKSVEKSKKITEKAGIETVNTKHKIRKITEQAGIETADTKHKYNEKETGLNEDGSSEQLVRIKRSSGTDLEDKRQKDEITFRTNVINSLRIPSDASRNSKATEHCSFQGPSSSIDASFNKVSQSVQGSSADNKECPFICKCCSKHFSKYKDYQNHVRIHTADKPYKCGDCDKSFSHPYCLRRHRKTHTGEKPYTCKVCGKSFIETSKLIIHERTHTGEKPYTCELCGKSFSQNIQLTIHKRTHTGEKPYICMQCHKCFADLSALKSHSRTHSGEKPFVCGICGKSFSLKGNMKKHEIICKDRLKKTRKKDAIQ